MISDWCTPPGLLDRVREVAPIDLDPCSNPLSLVNAKLNIGLDPALTPETLPGWADASYFVGDGLEARWRGFVYCNPPYNRIGPWIDKAITSVASDGADVCLVTPPSTASWFHRLMAGPTVAVALLGRVAFLQGGVPVTHNSRGTVLYYTGTAKGRARFLEVFRPLGTALLPVHA